MKKLVVFMILYLTGIFIVHGQDTRKQDPPKNSVAMKTYLIERQIPNAGSLTSEELKNISKQSNEVLEGMGSKNIKWLHSYVTENTVYCVYKAKDENLLKIHAEKGGFPIDKISELSTKISPKTAK